ncbi:MAG: hypothetical protein ACI81S_001569 [Sphingobacteriales bacterium]|jgi:hypothetical protein
MDFLKNYQGVTHGFSNFITLDEIKSFDWVRECFLHDPSGVLWHFEAFT